MIKKLLTILLSVLIAFTTITFNIAASVEETENNEDNVENDVVAVEEDKQDEILSKSVVNDSLEKSNEKHWPIVEIVDKKIETKNEADVIKYKLSEYPDGGMSSGGRTYIFVDTKEASESANLLVFNPENEKIESITVTVTEDEKNDLYVIGQHQNAEFYDDGDSTNAYLFHKYNNLDYHLCVNNNTLECSASNKSSFVSSRMVPGGGTATYNQYYLGYKNVGTYPIYYQNEGGWGTEVNESHVAFIYEKVVNVTFNPNGGTYLDGETPKVIETVGHNFIFPEEPTKDGYKFDGWYTEKDGGEKISQNKFDGIEHILYAHWVKYVEYEKITDSDYSKLTGEYIIANIQSGGDEKKNSINDDTQDVYLMKTIYGKGLELISSQAKFVDDSTIAVAEDGDPETLFTIEKDELDNNYYLKTKYEEDDYYLNLSSSTIEASTTGKTPISLEDGGNIKFGDGSDCYAFWDEYIYCWSASANAETYLYKLKENTPTISTVGDVLATNPNFPKKEEDSWLSGSNKCYLDETQLKFNATATKQPSVKSNDAVELSENGYVLRKNGYSVSFVLDNDILERIVFVADTGASGKLYSAYNGTYAVPQIHNGVTFAMWDPKEHNGKLPNPNESGNWYLAEDAELSGDWYICDPSYKGLTINLCLNGHVIDNNGNRIVMDTDSTLNLYDCNTTLQHNGYVDANGLWHLDENKEHVLGDDEIEKTIIGGLITGGSQGVSVGGVATFNMHGGTICGNSSSDYDNGIGVCLPAGDGQYFNMYGGTICYNVATQSGGGIYIEDELGTTTIYGGSIINNKAKYGGGIYNEGIMNLTAGSEKEINITGNVATDAIGGVANYGTMSLSGKVIIKDNVCENEYNDNSINYPINLATSSPIAISGALTNSEILITHANADYKHDAGVLTNGYLTNNASAELNTFFTYEGPNSHCKMLLNPSDAESNPGELKSVGIISAHVDDETYYYSGSGIEPELEFTFLGTSDEQELTEDVDYTVTYSNNINASWLYDGTRDSNNASGKVTLINDIYVFEEDKKEITVNFEITPKPLNISLDSTSIEYGSPIPSITFADMDKKPISIGLLDDDADLDTNDGYQVSYYTYSGNIESAVPIKKDDIKDVGTYFALVVVSRNYYVNTETAPNSLTKVGYPHRIPLLFEIVDSTEKIIPELLSSAFTYNGYNQIKNLKFDCDKDKIADKIVSPYLTFPKSSYGKKDVAINAGTYVTYLKINDPSKYEWDDTVKLTDDKKYAIVEWTIKPATVRTYLRDDTFVYDGNNHKPTPTLVITSGLLAGHPLSSKNYSLSYSKDVKNVGNKEVTIALNNNYCFDFGDKPIYNTSLSYRITPKPVTVSWSRQDEFEYNGVQQTPTPSVYGILGKDSKYVGVDLYVTKENGTTHIKSIDAGSYVAHAVLTGDVYGNYVIDSTYFRPNTKHYKITPKHIYVEWIDAEPVVYDGKAHSANLMFMADGKPFTPYNSELICHIINLPVLEDKEVTGKDFNLNANTAIINRVIDAGDYRAHALITGKLSNYIIDGTKKDLFGLLVFAAKDFTINQRELKVLWSDQVKFKYDGNEHAPEILGAVAIIDGEEVEPGIVARDEGLVELKLDITNGKKIQPGSNYKAEAILTSKGTNHRANNYRIVENKTINFKIYRKPNEDITPVKTGVDR